VNQVSINMEGAVTELTGANEYHKRARQKTCCLLVFFAILAIVILLVVLP
jgi:t-SNARE complex subunit (syntaxin)